ncbi:NFAT activation molecule 1 [Gouania willdenowi]|uniref:NFAT activation molecule 1 n=1 Tax=Gouania willdenowi TaxID=441366 RepID=UPI00105495D0|nr:uncharacterized protein LOC114466895 [Gouania willdenowi]XP_028308575.1 uncharacterized protein LOC114466895 [Gouania willdenowi]XP_028308583.1 uncharacterized protein LOC114466895 [Gouania willdenowi]
MQTQRIWLFLVIFSCITVIFLPCTCSGLNTPEMILESTVFMAFKGGELTIKCVLRKPINQTKDFLRCFNPSNAEIFRVPIPETGSIETTTKLELKLTNLVTSGEYHCQYKTVKESWFLRVRAEGYRMPPIPNYPEFITMAIITGFLLLFSVVGSVYVFRGHWRNTNRDDSGKKQTKENQQNPEEEEYNVDVTGAQSTSFYASLDSRPRSVYDVLDCSDANKEPSKNKLKPKKSELLNTVQPNIEQPDEGVFESVYENI